MMGLLESRLARLLGTWAVLLVLIVSLGAVAGAQGLSGDILGLAGFTPSLIEVIRGDARIVIQKNGSGWDLVEPVRDRADQGAVESMLARLGNLTVADVLEGSPEQFGLDSPQATVRLTDGSGQTKELVIGSLRSPVSLFVAPAGSRTVYAVSNVSLARIGQDAAAFLDRVLIELDPAQVVSYEVLSVPATARAALDADEPQVEPQSVEALDGESVIDGLAGDAKDEGEQVVLRASIQNGVWVTDEGYVAFDVDGFLRAVRLVQAADRAMDVPEDAFYPAAGTTHIRLGFASGRTLSIDIGRESGDGKYNYVKVSERDEVYLVPRFQAAHVVGQAMRINDSLITIDPERVSQLTIAIGPGGESVVYRRNNNGLWESNRSIVFNFAPLLEAFNSVEARRAAVPLSDPAGYGFETAPRSVRAEIRFTDNNSINLWIGGPTQAGDGVYVQTSDRPGVYAGVESSVDELIAAAQAVRTRLFPLDAATVTAVEVLEVDASGNARVIRLDKSGSAWEGDGRTVGDSAVQNLLTQLGQLAADDLPAPPEDPDELGFYPASDSKRIIVEFSDGSQRYLDVGGKVEVGSGWFATVNYYVQVSDLDDLMFVREQTLRRIFQALDALR